MRLRVVPNAATEIREAAAWWQANRPVARSLFREELASGFALITTQPGIGLRTRELTGVRRLHLSRIHYYLYYRVQGDTVEVLSFWHTSRGKEPSF